MKAIGGYFELELCKGEHYHKNAIRLNTGRNCLEYILRVRLYRKVYIPYYTCDVILEPFHKLNVAYEFYSVDEYLNPLRNYLLQPDEAFLYTNYFGVKQKQIDVLVAVYGKQLIVDNSQAFYALASSGIDTFYSARKFFGVSDGAYLFIDKLLDESIIQDESFERMTHLLKRSDLNAEVGYNNFKMNDLQLKNQPIKKMSKLTEKILCSVDYELVRQQRLINYKILDLHLSAENGLKTFLSEGDIPMVYPFKTDNHNLRHELISNHIYVATYWPNVFEWNKKDDIEYDFAKNIIPLPIDQRYDSIDMKRILEVVK